MRCENDTVCFKYSLFGGVEVFGRQVFYYDDMAAGKVLVSSVYSINARKKKLLWYRMPLVGCVQHIPFLHTSRTSFPTASKNTRSMK